MKRRTLSLVLMLVALALPLSASQFVNIPFDEAARGANLVVRGNVIDTFSAWNDSRDVIYTYATVRVTRYFGETTGPDTLVVREVGGLVDGYMQEAIGFPMLRRGEAVVLLLTTDDEGSYRIHAYNQGKFLVRERRGREVLISDPVKQGDARLQTSTPRFQLETEAVEDAAALSIEEFALMIEDARAGAGRPVIRHQQQ